ncbi:DUF1156 domain-containing protein [uncultured Desulfovibrio sp.]|uniref:DUF1156 domain-containing protein n=1 Tax=uncultured Desulfovibrio sp. TaxID=167968 RepID=UPI0026166276|nr:DUF1156 domain-containing protein [uncultured Desulfovibrio sp.]
MSEPKNDARLIEAAFPLKQTSLDAVHEKNVRHGHLSTLHIWPARRPLAACRAALLATLLPDPGTTETRKHLCERIGGTVKQAVGDEQRATQETEGGVLHWLGTEPKNGKKAIQKHRDAVAERERELEKFRKEIREAHGGRAPRVLDPFSGGGAIPLEAMRLGCEAHAVDLNPVAAFVLGATLKYPQAVGNKKVPLPNFIRSDAAFMKEFAPKKPELWEKDVKARPQTLTATEDPYLADLAWHVRAWGQWVLKDARKSLAKRYPTYAVYEPIDEDALYEPQEMKLVPLKADGSPDVDALNKDFNETYLKNEKNPRWIARPTVAYLWARTATCKNCRNIIPLLKTKWLCKTKNGKRVALKVEAKDGIIHMGLWNDVPMGKGTPAQKRAFDLEVGKGFMSGAGATCPHCGNIMTMEDLRREGKSGRLGVMPTAVVAEGRKSKEYRPYFIDEINMANVTQEEMEAAFKDVPFGIPDEPTPDENALGMRIPKYGFNHWRDLFSARQLLAMGTLVTSVRKAIAKCDSEADTYGYNQNWVEAIGTYLAIGMDRIADRQSTICRWDQGYAKLQGTFVRFALPMTWDYCEGNPLSDSTGNFYSGIEWVSEYIDHAISACENSPMPSVTRQSAMSPTGVQFDAIVTDPPYYDAIPYSDCMDFFYIWLKRVTSGNILDNGLFAGYLAPKWDTNSQDGELIDDSTRHAGDKVASKKAYEDGMAQVFVRCHESLMPDGRFVVVFAHKHPDAWETLVSAMIRAGFTVTASWPIQTEMGNRLRGLSSAALSSSVWLVCKKRDPSEKFGWDNQVLTKMENSITEKLRAFWDAGIRGPDFVWAATGPALTAYSAFPVVKKTSSPGESMSVTEFLSHVRRMVMNFVVGRLLKSDGADDSDEQRMDAVTAYYLLHRNDFGMEDAPAGACILYATACGLSDKDLESGYRIVTKKGSSSAEPDDDDEAEDDKSGSEDSGSATGSGKMALLPWSKRDHKGLGIEAPGGAEVPLIDRAHKLMHLWKEGDVGQVDTYIDSFSLRRSEPFKQLLQALTELSENSERSMLESISNHLHAKGATPTMQVGKLGG